MAKSTETREALNARVLSTVTVQPHVIANMRAIMTKPWPKLAGTQPTDAMLMAAAAYSKNTAGAEAMFMALQMRDEGCSVLQLGQACGAGPAHNHSRDHSGKVWHNFNRGKAGTGVYLLTFTAKGEKWLGDFLAKQTAAQSEGAAVKPAKAVKAVKGKAKAKKARVIAPNPETPTSDAPTAAEGVSPEMNQTTEMPAPELGGIDSDHDAVSEADVSALAAHFNQQ